VNEPPPRLRYIGEQYITFHKEQAHRKKNSTIKEIKRQVVYPSQVQSSTRAQEIKKTRMFPSSLSHNSHPANQIHHVETKSNKRKIKVKSQSPSTLSDTLPRRSFPFFPKYGKKQMQPLFR
jgi:hypothetical protein